MCVKIDLKCTIITNVLKFETGVNQKRDWVDESPFQPWLNRVSYIYIYNPLSIREAKNGKPNGKEGWPLDPEGGSNGSCFKD